eukprot:CAMPEP_0169480204 /NCGR_PEP_ID=MMETSP1042-20121227/29442_1 /TAXON_ID=464988 /ORGANISM="Hemiselmis andersenii, Strain CCMP1180" /LENGTH=72 /DNA_ID=CAMNT_0009594839 /DNA_START=36 /DNA_END=251 /DNA_ORIENTATION=-
MVAARHFANSRTPRALGEGRDEVGEGLIYALLMGTGQAGWCEMGHEKDMDGRPGGTWEGCRADGRHIPSLVL